MKTYSYKQIWQIAFPIIVSSLMEQLVGMTDTAFLGRVGEVELGASALGGIFYISVFMLVLGFSLGAQILIGRRNGEGKYEAIGSIFYHSIFFLLLMGIGLFLLTSWIAPPLLSLIISSREVYEASWIYLNWRMWGFFFAIVNCMFRAFFVGTTQTGVLKFNSIAMVGSNILLDYALIFGKFGCPELGIAGAAIASALSALVSTLFFLAYMWWRVDLRKYALHRLPHLRFGLLGHILGISVWMMVQNFISLATWFIFFVAIEHLGARELAVTNVLRSISAFTFMSLIALASTASTLASNLIGSGETDAVPAMVERAVRLGCYILLPTWALIFIFPEAVLRIFTDSSAIVAAGVAPLYVLGASYVFQVPGQILFHTVSGTGNTRTALCFEIVALSIYTAYVLVVILGFRAPLAWCWLSEEVYALVCFALSWWYIRYGNWRAKRI